MTKISSPWEIAPFGHSGSQAPQLMHSSVIIVAIETHSFVGSGHLPVPRPAAGGRGVSSVVVRRLCRGLGSEIVGRLQDFRPPLLVGRVWARYPPWRSGKLSSHGSRRAPPCLVAQAGHAREGSHPALRRVDEIGRASCRERGESWVVAGAAREKS